MFPVSQLFLDNAGLIYHLVRRCSANTRRKRSRTETTVALQFCVTGRSLDSGSNGLADNALYTARRLAQWGSRWPAGAAEGSSFDRGEPGASSEATCPGADKYLFGFVTRKPGTRKKHNKNGDKRARRLRSPR